MKNKNFFYALYSSDGEKLLGVYNNISDIVVSFYGIPKNTSEFNKKKHSLESTISKKKKTSSPRKWAIYKIRI